MSNFKNNLKLFFAANATKFPIYTKFLFYTFSLIFFSLAILLIFNAPDIVEFSSEKNIIKIIEKPSDFNYLVIFLLLISSIFFLIVSNGYKIKSLSFKDTTITLNDYEEREEEIKQALSSPNPIIENVPENVIDPLPDSVGTKIRVGDEDEYIYSAESLPVKIVVYLLSNEGKWPEEVGKPKLIKDLINKIDYCARKKGQGNHPWKIKFKDLDTIVVISFGGQGKTEATIRT